MVAAFLRSGVLCQIYARCTTPRVGTNRTVGQTQVPIPCGGIIVNPGDHVRGDDDGVTIIPAPSVEQVTAKAETRLQQEAEYVQRMEAGEHISDLIGFTELIYGKDRPPRTR